MRYESVEYKEYVRSSDFIDSRLVFLSLFSFVYDDPAIDPLTDRFVQRKHHR